MKFKIYTDGACSGNPGKGGWAAVILDGRNQSNININKGGAIELYYDGSYKGWVVMYYRNN